MLSSDVKVVVLVPATAPDVNAVVVRVVVISGDWETVLPLELVNVEKVVSEVTLDELVVLVNDITVDEEVVLVVS